MKKKKVVLGVILSYMSQFVQIVTALIYTPFMMRTLGKSEYGLYQLVASVVSYLSLFNLGFGSSYIRFYFKRKDSENKNAVAELNGMYMTIFGVLAMLCLICGEILIQNITWVFGDGLNVSEYNTARVLMQLMVVNITITFPMSVFNSYITAHEEFVIQKGIVLLGDICNPFLCILLLLTGYGSVSLIIVSLGINIIKFITVCFVSLKRLHMKFSFHNFNFFELKEMWIFTFFIFLNEIINQVNWNVDKFLLGRFSGTGEVAVYGAASQFNTLYMAISTAISNVFAPRVNQMVSESDDNKKLTELFTKVGRLQFMVVFLVLSGFIIFGRKFISLWAGKGYEGAYAIVITLLLPVTIPLIQNIGIEIQRAKNMHKTRSVVYFFGALANIIISIPLIQSYGGFGAAIGTCITMVMGNVLFMNWYYHFRIGLDIKFFWRKLVSFIPVIALCGCVGVLLHYVLDFNKLYWYLSGIFIYVLLYLVMLFLFVFTKEEKQKVLKRFGKERYGHGN